MLSLHSQYLLIKLHLDLSVIAAERRRPTDRHRSWETGRCIYERLRHSDRRRFSFFRLSLLLARRSHRTRFRLRCDNSRTCRQDLLLSDTITRGTVQHHLPPPQFLSARVKNAEIVNMLTDGVFSRYVGRMCYRFVTLRQVGRGVSMFEHA